MSVDPDQSFFFRHPKRQITMRLPHLGESEAEFLTLGDHDRSRRRILVWKVPNNAKLYPGHILRIPYLLFADEQVRDDDETLLPLLDAVMKQAGAEYGVTRSH